MQEYSPLELYSHLLKELNGRQLAFVEVREAEDGEIDEGRKQMPDCLAQLRPFFKGAFIANQGYTPETGLRRI